MSTSAFGPIVDFSLFQELENLDVDGCVFNPEGPGPTVLKGCPIYSRYGGPSWTIHR